MTPWEVVSGAHRDKLGEGPVWSVRRNKLLWVDILAQAVQQISLDTGKIDRWTLPERVGWVVERRSSNGLLAGLKSGVTALNFDPLHLATISAPEADRPQNRLNDAKVDAAGRLWFGSKDDNDRQSSGALYRLDANWQCTRQDDHYLVANGPAFSLDGRTLWHADSLRSTVYAFTLGEDGNVSHRREFLHFPENWGLPDGMAVDAEGCLWIAHWGAGRVSRFTPEGRLDRFFELPVPYVTSLCFGGQSFDRLFVTSARNGSMPSHLAGALFELRSGVKGLAPVDFAG